MFTTAIVATLTMTGLTIATAAIKPLRDVAALAPTPSVRRAWFTLIVTIAVCIALQFAALMAKLFTAASLSDVLAACVHLLGPGFVLAVAWLARRTARDILRIADLERAVLLDPLTLLPNRRFFDAQFADHITRCRGSGEPLHLVLLDIDHFKGVNDTFGHRSGDTVLRQVATLAQAVSRDQSLVCRIGGEEFAIIKPRLAPNQVLAAVERVRRTIEQAEIVLPEGGTVRVTVSMGTAVLRADDNAESLFSRADAALYAAKRAGRNRTSVAA